jgi:hypothetical protein
MVSRARIKVGLEPPATEASGYRTWTAQHISPAGAPAWPATAAAVVLALASTACPFFHKPVQPPPPPVEVVNQPAMVINPPTVSEPVPAPPSNTTATATPPTQPARPRSTVVINNEPRGRSTPQHPIAAKPQPVTANGKNTPPATAPASSSPQLTIGSPEQLQRDRQETVQYLNNARTDLKALEGKRLSNEQTSTVAQANEYVREAQSALDQGDVLKAHNLAWKASLLAGALVSNQ